MWDSFHFKSRYWVIILALVALALGVGGAAAVAFLGISNTFVSPTSTVVSPSSSIVSPSTHTHPPRTVVIGVDNTISPSSSIVLPSTSTHPPRTVVMGVDNTVATTSSIVLPASTTVTASDTSESRTANTLTGNTTGLGTPKQTLVDRTTTMLTGNTTGLGTPKQTLVDRTTTMLTGKSTPTPGTPSIGPNLRSSGPDSSCYPNLCSKNWAGYAVQDGGFESVTKVNGSWVMPALVGPCPLKSEYALFAVGIDGFGSSQYTEQVGTGIYCDGVGPTPQYFAWYQAFPSQTTQQIITAMTVKPGDKINAAIYAPNFCCKFPFIFSIKDVTHPASFTKTLIFPKNTPPKTSAEWITESGINCPPGTSFPSCAKNRLNIQPLIQFGTVNFGLFFTGIKHTCTATINGVTGSIGSFPNTKITMLSVSLPSPGAVKAIASTLQGGAGSSFEVAWKNAGP